MVPGGEAVVLDWLSALSRGVPAWLGGGGGGEFYVKGAQGSSFSLLGPIYTAQLCRMR